MTNLLFIIKDMLHSIYVCVKQSNVICECCFTLILSNEMCKFCPQNQKETKYNINLYCLSSNFKKFFLENSAVHYALFASASSEIDAWRYIVDIKFSEFYC